MPRKKEFVDSLLGKCVFRDGFYVINEMYGGYSYTCERGSGSVSYADPSKVLALAEKTGHDVSLAGGRWRNLGEKGMGQKVSVEKARDLVKKLMTARGFSFAVPGE